MKHDLVAPVPKHCLKCIQKVIIWTILKFSKADIFFQYENHKHKPRTAQFMEWKQFIDGKLIDKHA